MKAEQLPMNSKFNWKIMSCHGVPWGSAKIILFILEKFHVHLSKCDIRKRNKRKNASLNRKGLSLIPHPEFGTGVWWSEKLISCPPWQLSTIAIWCIAKWNVSGREVTGICKVRVSRKEDEHQYHRREETLEMISVLSQKAGCERTLWCSHLCQGKLNVWKTGEWALE